MNEKLVLVNFAIGEPFETYRSINSWTGIHIGKADKVIEYSLSDIDEKYRVEHQNIFNYKRGCGLWLWKPYLILKALDEIEESDWLFYCDSGAFFVRSIWNLVKCAELNGDDKMLFELSLLDRQFTKRECYKILGVEDTTRNQILATYLLIKKTESNVNLVREWLCLCEDERLISPNKYFGEVKEFEDFYEHREDQSLLSLLSIKHCFRRYRDCSDWGNIPFLYNKFLPTYVSCSLKVYENSNYKTILISHRKTNPLLHTCKYIIRYFLFKIGLFKL